MMKESIIVGVVYQAFENFAQLYLAKDGIE